MISIQYSIPPQWNGKEIFRILKEELEFSTLERNALRQNGTVLLDGIAADTYITVNQGQILSLLLPDDPPSDIVPTQGDLDVVYEDEHLLVINKQAGVSVHPCPDHHFDTLGNFVTWYYQNKGENHLFRPVNRLDRGTSGLMVVAKHSYAAQKLNRQLHTEHFSRSYLALCEGAPTPPSGTIDAPIGRKEGSVIERQVRCDGKQSITEYKIINNYVNHSLVEAIPRTGRTHQIRVHMSHIGHPLLGDFLYGTEDHSLISRAALHCGNLIFHHPVSGERLTFQAPLPEDMAHLAR